ncbi:MAG: hypothetical protein E6K88_08805 [Thaumarchaeota archaeon]|nr:MAG: hypothetical protein E6K88_08805 [Nitrososphaerota archaeon]
MLAEGANQTKIMYKSYLSILAANDLIEENETERHFRTTEKGMKFMRIYQRMGELRGPLQERKM